MAVCTVSLTTDKAAMSGAIHYEPIPGQVISNVFVDASRVTASASSNTYSAALIQGAKYRIISSRFPFDNAVFTAPASSSANLYDLLEGYRGG